jgi:hypothetical protein
VKTIIVTRRRGIKLTTAEICVRYVDSEEEALRAYPQIRTYERYVFEDKKEVRYWSPAACRFYDRRNIMDSFKTIYLTD